MAQTIAAASISLIIGWVGFGIALQHAPTDTAAVPQTSWVA